MDNINYKYNFLCWNFTFSSKYFRRRYHSGNDNNNINNIIFNSMLIATKTIEISDEEIEQLLSSTIWENSLGFGKERK